MFFEVLLIVVVVIVLIYLFFSYANVLLAPITPQNQLGSVCAGERCFNVEIAKTWTQREIGLMNREKLEKDRGMLFVFDKEDIYPFWMKNTLIPLDMIWIGDNSNVVFISKNVQPCKSLICPSIVPSSKAKYVLEINAGIVDKIGLKVGDELKVSIK
jgi:uncharacterized protein